MILPIDLVEDDVKIVVASGKGGTGKTTVSLGLAWVASNLLKINTSLLDADVEAPNDHLYFNCEWQEHHFVDVVKPLWNSDKCTACGQCVDICQFNALAKVKNKVMVFDELCHSCGACIALCPEQAFIAQNVPIGEIRQVNISSQLRLAQGELNIGESLAPKIIRNLKEIYGKNELVIIDSSPGTTCPVVESMKGADFCLLVTEPTPFGLHDLKLAVELTRQLNIPTAIVINRSEGEDAIIEDFAQKIQIPILLKIAFSRAYAAASAEGKILAEHFPELQQHFLSLLEQLPLQSRISADFVEDISIADHAIALNEGHGKAPPELVVISGKGGTGKTTLSTSLSYLLPELTLADADVDAANFNLVGESQLLSSEQFVGGKKYAIDRALCSQCGLCADVCAYHAIEKESPFVIDDGHCEGCGLCARICPQLAITSYPSITGDIYLSQTDRGYLSHAKLGIGEENSGKLVKQVRDQAKELASKAQSRQVLIDGPPGTGCPVISCISGVKLALIVTEPSLSGLHDLRRAISLCKHFRVPFKVVINKCDLSLSLSEKVRREVIQAGSEIIGEIPFDPQVFQALQKGKSIVFEEQSEARKVLVSIANILREEE